MLLLLLLLVLVVITIINITIITGVWGGHDPLALPGGRGGAPDLGQAGRAGNNNAYIYIYIYIYPEVLKSGSTLILRAGSYF